MQQIHISPGCQGVFLNHLVTLDYSVYLDANIMHFEWDWDLISFLPAVEYQEMSGFEAHWGAETPPARYVRPPLSHSARLHLDLQLYFGRHHLQHVLPSFQCYLGCLHPLFSCDPRMLVLLCLLSSMLTLKTGSPSSLSASTNSDRPSLLPS